MKALVVGIQSVNFKDDDGNAVSGTKLHLVHNDINVFGRSASTKFIASGNPLEQNLTPYLNDMDTIIDHVIDIDVDLKGRIQAIEVLEAGA